MNGKERIRKWKKRMAGMLVAVLTAVSVLPAGAFAAVQDITITSKENKVPTYQAGKSQKWTLTVTNRTSGDLENVVLGQHICSSLNNESLLLVCHLIQFGPASAQQKSYHRQHRQ